MKFAIVIQSSPFSRQSTATAYRFAKALLEQEHELFRVFFYSDAVLLANNQVSPAQDEQQLPQLWQELGQKYNLDLVVCIAAAVRRGVLDSNEAKRYEKDTANLQQGFELSGLGQLAEALAVCDRVVTFGG